MEETPYWMKYFHRDVQHLPFSFNGRQPHVILE